MSDTTYTRGQWAVHERTWTDYLGHRHTETTIVTGMTTHNYTHPPP